MILVMAEIWTYTFYSTWEPEIALDALIGVATGLHFVDILARFVIFGPKAYWFYSNTLDWTRKRNPLRKREVEEQEFANRWDFCLMVITVLLLIILGGMQTRTDLLRFTMSIMLLRAFTLVKSTRSLLYTLVPAMPAFSSLVALLLLVIYIYGIYGMLLFSDKLDVILQSRSPSGNFNGLNNAMITLFQIFIGTKWQTIMYAAVLTTSWSSLWYFVSFVVLVTLLFSNLFIGVILAVFTNDVTGLFRNTGHKRTRTVEAN